MTRDLPPPRERADGVPSRPHSDPAAPRKGDRRKRVSKRRARRPGSAGPAIPRLSHREVLCEIPAGRVERAGRGAARWGRHFLAADSVSALRTVGAFGTVERGDFDALFETRRRSREARLQLADEGLLLVESFRRGTREIETVTLTRSGRRLLERSVDPRDPGDMQAQRYRSGPARSAQVLHDAAVYRAARLEMDRVESEGGRVTRILSDGDLRRLANRRIDRALRAGAAADAAREEAAAGLGLIVRRGTLVYPDARIEFERPASTGGPGFVDVEVSTPDYRRAALEAKAAAGFRMYRMGADGSLRPDSGEPEHGMAR